MQDKSLFISSDSLLSFLGSFWIYLFQDKHVVQTLMTGVQTTLEQAYFNFLEMVTGQSIQEIPIFHKEKWRLLILKQSEANKATKGLWQYGETINFGDPEVTYAGVGKYPQQTFKLPYNIVDTQSFITNRVYAPSLVLVKNVDFFIKNKIISFQEDPFKNPLIANREIRNAEGNIIDKEVALWLLNSDEDYKFLWHNFGYIFDIKLESSEIYKTILMTIWRMFVKGPLLENLSSAINALMGLPLIRETQEQIKYLTNETIVTDYHIYELPITLRKPLQIGQTLLQLTSLSNIITIVDISKQTDWWDALEYATFSPELLSPDITSSIILHNAPVSFSTRIGETFVFPVLGDLPPKKRQLFNSFSPRIGWGRWFIGYGAGSIRPLSTIVENFYKNNTFFLKISFPKGKFLIPFQQVIVFIKEALPAWVYFLLNVSLPYNIENFSLTASGHDTLSLQRGHPLRDEFNLHGNIMDGFWGVPLIGELHLSVGMHWPIGRQVMSPSIRVLKTFL